MMDYKGCKCASCHKVLKEGDDVVICPECGAPYHRECYAAEGRCVFSAKHGKGFEYVPPEDADAYAAFVRSVRERLSPAGYTVFAALAPKTSAAQQGLLYEMEKSLLKL